MYQLIILLHCWCIKRCLLYIWMPKNRFLYIPTGYLCSVKMLWNLYIMKNNRATNHILYSLIHTLPKLSSKAALKLDLHKKTKLSKLCKGPMWIFYISLDQMSEYKSVWRRDFLRYLGIKMLFILYNRMQSFWLVIITQT